MSGKQGEPLHFYWGVESPTKFSKKRGEKEALHDHNFQMGIAGVDEAVIFQGGLVIAVFI